MSIEATIFHQYNFAEQPVTLIYSTKKQETLLDVSRIVDDSYTERTDFNYMFINFGEFFLRNELTASVLPGERIIKSQGNLKLAKESPELNNAFATIKSMANLNKSLSESQSTLFLDAYKTVYSVINEHFPWINSDAFIVPLMGGGVITSLFDIDPKKRLSIDCKRLPLKAKNDTFGFGMHMNTEEQGYTVKEAHQFTESLDGKVVSMLEICIVSGITTCGFLLDLYAKNVKPKKIQVVAAAVSQQGWQLVNSFAKELGYEVEFLTGKMVYSVGDFYAKRGDLLVEEDGLLTLKSPWDAFQKVNQNRKKRK